MKTNACNPRGAPADRPKQKIAVCAFKKQWLHVRYRILRMKSVLITGCNRGLGLEFVRQLVKQQNPPAKIIATCRSLEKAQVWF